MAIDLDHKQVFPILRGGEFPDSVRVSAAVDPGTVVAPEGNGSGNYTPGTGAGAGVVLTRVLSGGQTVSILREGELDLGSAVQMLSEGAAIYADANGALTDEDGAGANVQVGTLIPVKGGPSGATNVNGSRNLLRLSL